ncbi:MAG TPA: dicarboxylate/amino acid:cation symporter [Polyangiaceae bacterium]
MVRLALHWQILIALAAALAVGSVATETTALFGVRLLDVCAFLGNLFLRALKMLVVPLIMASIISAVAELGATRDLGRLGLKTLGYYFATSLAAILLGLAMVNLMQPGIIDGEPAKDRIGLDAESDEVAARVEGRTGKDVVDVFLRLVPENVIADAAEGQMLGLIFFALVFGFFVSRIPERYQSVLKDFWQGVYQVMLLITDWVIKFAPIGVFGLVAKVVLTTGLGALRPLAVFFSCVVLALAIHMFVVLPVVVALVARVSPLRHFKAMVPALLMAFSTASSSATLPVTLDRVQRGSGVSPRVASFTLPLGATVNMDGTALYECVAAMFIAQAYGIHLGGAEQFLIVAVALLTSVGVAGIPSASLVAIALILSSVGLPLEGLGLILAVDRILDMCRTAVNVFSDSCAAVVIAKSEGETGVLVEAPRAQRDG